MNGDMFSPPELRDCVPVGDGGVVMITVGTGVS